MTPTANSAGVFVHTEAGCPQPLECGLYVQRRRRSAACVGQRSRRDGVRDGCRPSSGQHCHRCSSARDVYEYHAASNVISVAGKGSTLRGQPPREFGGDGYDYDDAIVWRPAAGPARRSCSTSTTVSTCWCAWSALRGRALVAGLGGTYDGLGRPYVRGLAPTSTSSIGTGMGRGGVCPTDVPYLSVPAVVTRWFRCSSPTTRMHRPIRRAVARHHVFCDQVGMPLRTRINEGSSCGGAKR